MVNVPLKKKKKKCRLARLGELGSPGRATSAPKYKNDEGGDVFSFKNFPPSFKKESSRDSRILQPLGHHFLRF